ncbi:hypothetical protein LQZ18_18630 [Lachnospiraceae bacterium ZAX-1]
MDLNYRLSAKDMEESLLCINWKREGIRKKVNIYILNFLGFVLLGMYLKHKAQSILLIFAFLTILLLFFLLYIPSFQRRKKARQISQGMYHMVLSKSGISGGTNLREYEFTQYKPLVLESEHVYTIQVGKNAFCIPKAALNGSQTEEFHEIMSHADCRRLKFKTRER